MTYRSNERFKGGVNLNDSSFQFKTKLFFTPALCRVGGGFQNRDKISDHGSFQQQFMIEKIK